MKTIDDYQIELRSYSESIIDEYAPKADETLAMGTLQRMKSYIQDFPVKMTAFEIAIRTKANSLLETAIQSGIEENTAKEAMVGTGKDCIDSFIAKFKPGK